MKFAFSTKKSDFKLGEVGVKFDFRCKQKLKCHLQFSTSQKHHCSLEIQWQYLLGDLFWKRVHVVCCTTTIILKFCISSTFGKVVHIFNRTCWTTLECWELCRSGVSCQVKMCKQYGNHMFADWDGKVTSWVQTHSLSKKPSFVYSGCHV